LAELEARFSAVFIQIKMTQLEERIERLLYFRIQEEKLWGTMHFSETVKQPLFEKALKYIKMYGIFFSNLRSIMSKK